MTGRVAVAGRSGGRRAAPGSVTANTAGGTSFSDKCRQRWLHYSCHLAANASAARESADTSAASGSPRSRQWKFSTKALFHGAVRADGPVPDARQRHQPADHPRDELAGGT